jgi:hypothetical protein
MPQPSRISPDSSTGTVNQLQTLSKVRIDQRPNVPKLLRFSSIAAYMLSAKHGGEMADLYLKALESERKALWATCRLKGLAQDTPERQRIVELDGLLRQHKEKKKGA